MTVSLLRQRDADRNITDAVSQVRREWLHADIRSGADTLLLSDYEQSLSNHKYDVGRVTPT